MSGRHYVYQLTRHFCYFYTYYAVRIDAHTFDTHKGVLCLPIHLLCCVLNIMNERRSKENAEWFLEIENKFQI